MSAARGTNISTKEVGQDATAGAYAPAPPPQISFYRNGTCDRRDHDFDTALAKTKKETSTAQSQPQVQSSEVHSGADRQLQGRFYKRHKTHKHHTENK
jgi:hypothetical protein